MSASLPANEEQRIAKLIGYGILDTQAEPAYDDLAQLAAYICQTPIALVSLVDVNRQWFKSSIGIEICETPRDLAFCAHAILQPEVMVVPDAREDARFATNPLVTGEPYIRFYAGVPLITSDGLALGTLCVLDAQPRTLDEAQIQALTALGRQVISQIELNRSHRQLTQEIAEHQRLEAARREIEITLQEEQERLKAILDNLSDGIVACDETGRLMLFNRATQAFHGLPEAPLSPDEWAAHFDLFLADGVTPMPKEEIPLFRAFQGEVVQDAVMVIAPKQGKTRTLLANGRAFFDAAGNKLGAVVAMHDISDRQAAEAERDRMGTALRQSEARFQKLAENLPGTLYQFRVDADGTPSLPYINAFCKDLYEVEPEAAQENVNLILDCIHPEDSEAFRASINTSWQTLEPWDWVGRFIMPSGKVKWLHGLSRPERQADGSTIWDGLQLDISDRKQAQAERAQAQLALQKSEERYRSLTLATAQIVWTTTADGAVLEMQDWQAYTGQTAAEVADGGWLYAVHPDDQADTLKAWQRAVRTKSLFSIEYRIRRADGTYHYFAGRGLPILDTDGSILEWIGTCTNIDDRKQAENALLQALQETEYQSRLLRTVLDSTQDWIFMKDRDFRYILVNQGYAGAIAHTPDSMLGKTDLDLGFPEELVFGNPAKKIRGFRPDDQAALAGEVVHNPCDLAILADGSTRIFDTRKTPLTNSEGQIFAMLGFSRDLTDRHYAEEALRRSETQLKEKADELEQTLQELRQTQTQMIQAEKMSGLGQLVAGIAHEINNPVNFIHGNITPAGQYAQDLLGILNLYQTHLPHPSADIQAFADSIDLPFIKEDLPKLLSSMRMGTERIRDIVLSLRDFSRLDEHDIKDVDLHKGIDNTLAILGSRLKEKPDKAPIEVVKHYGDLPLVECYAGQLNQVFMSLLNNAIDALEDREATQIKQGLAPSPKRITLRTARLDSGWVQIAIADNGEGISEAIQSQIFDPFFTTKTVGKGTGMGLAISYQIIHEKHGGQLDCASTPGEGSEFVIQIPICQLESAPQTPGVFEDTGCLGSGLMGAVVGENVDAVGDRP